MILNRKDIRVDGDYTIFQHRARYNGAIRYGIAQKEEIITYNLVKLPNSDEVAFYVKIYEITCHNGSL